MRNRERGFSHILIFLFLIMILAAIGFSGWRVYTLQHAVQASTQNNGNNTTNTVMNSNASTGAVIKSLKDRLATNFTVDTPGTLSVISAGHVTFKLTNNQGADWYIPGYTFSVHSNIGTEIAITSVASSDNAAIRDSMAAQLVADGLKKTAPPTQPTIPETEDAGNVTFYVGNKVVCEMDSSIQDVTLPLTIFCTDLAVYPQVYEEIKPFADAFFAVAPAKANKVIFWSPTIKASKTSGYSIVMDNAYWPYDPEGVFYEKDGHWTFFNTSGSGLLCDTSGYPSDIRLAFLGQQCVNPGGWGGTIQ